MTIKEIENGIFFANDDPHLYELVELVSNLNKIKLNDDNTYNVIRFIEYCKKSKYFPDVSKILDEYFFSLWMNNKEDRFVQMVILAHEDICNKLRNALNPMKEIPSESNRLEKMKSKTIPKQPTRRTIEYNHQ